MSPDHDKREEKDVQARIKRYEKMGYKTITDKCSECGNDPGNYWFPKEQRPMYFNYKTGYIFCTRCGWRYKV